jgi:RHH-type proline utilization regulon transcriptional repressor/proline dehydrogenase/delta 1-pyrroline-5-carboxylate dehydrogenase
LPPPTASNRAARGPATLPGPTGESNRLRAVPRAALLCLGPGTDTVAAQCRAVAEVGGQARAVSDQVDPATLSDMAAHAQIGGALWWGDDAQARAYDEALARRDGPLVPLIRGRPDTAQACLERHVCVDTTAAGGNAALLGGHDTA